MTKIRAGSFGLDIAGLLIDTHNDNAQNQYTKMIEKFNSQILGINKDIDSRTKGLNKVINDTNISLSRKMNEATKDAKELANDRAQELHKLEKLNDDMWNRAIPEKISKAMDEATNSVPKSTVYYQGPNGRESIDHPSPGDICWESGAWDESASNTLKARAYRYELGTGWVPIKGNQDIYGSNIFGAEIKGGIITGAFFRSNEQGALGTPFQVDDHGKIYAQDFKMDLLHNVTTEVNECNYSGRHDEYSGKDKNVPGGLNFTNGMLHMSAHVDQVTGKYINVEATDFIGKTYMEPNYLKLRSLSPKDENHVIGRTDIRGGNIEVSNQWNQDSGVMIGYWTDNYTHGSSPEIQLANDMEIYRTGAGHMGFIAKNGFIFHQDVDIAGDSDLYIHGKSLRDYIKSVIRNMKKQ